MKHDQSTSAKTAKQILDHSATEIGERHRLRLEQMTTNAVTQYSTKPRKNHRQFALPLAMASSVVFVLWLWWPLKQPSVPQSSPAIATITPSDAVVPEWVTDTAIPISLLNDMAFYDWLARQEDKQNHG